MSYFIEDSEAEWLGDIASNYGIIAMHEDERLPKSVKEFLEEAVADESMVKQMLKDLKDLPEYTYISDILSKAENFPIILTDGVGFAE